LINSFLYQYELEKLRRTQVASIIDALKVAALTGVTITILIPGISDSRFVNAVAWTNYGPLLRCGVNIYLYEKGFIHAKTMVVDEHISIVGTANMDIRSFDLNFEVNAVVYSQDFARQLGESFIENLSHSRKLNYKVWEQRPAYCHHYFDIFTVKYAGD
jgi:cardiolipin synthase